MNIHVRDNFLAIFGTTGVLPANTVATSMIVANAVTEMLSAIQSAPSGTTSSASYVAAPAPFATVSITATGGYVVVDGTLQIRVTAAGGALSTYGISVDAGATTTLASFPVPSGASSLQVTVPIMGLMGALSAGAHSLHFWWLTSAGSLDWNTAIFSQVRVQEFKK